MYEINPIEDWFVITTNDSVYSIGEVDTSQDDYWDFACNKAEQIAAENNTDVALLRSIYQIDELIDSLVEFRNKFWKRKDYWDEIVIVCVPLSNDCGDFEMIDKLAEEYPDSEIVQQIKINSDRAREIEE